MDEKNQDKILNEASENPTTGAGEAENPLRAFLTNLLCGVAMGVAFIIPGFSGGSIAAIVGVYEKLIGSVTGIFTKFKESIKTLLPIGIGMVAGAVSLLFPISWALEAYPIPTVCLFVGLTLGGMPSLTDKVPGKPRATNITALIIPLIFAAGLCFLPVGADVNLIGIGFGGYVVLFLIGIIGSSAMVIPGISGSMLLLILGYYNPIVKLLTEHLLKGEDILNSILVLGTVALGIATGFIGISFIMKFCFARYPRGTYFAIIGFVIGSIPSVFTSTINEAGITQANIPTDFMYWFMSVLLLLVGAAMSFTLVMYAKKKASKEG